MRMARTMVVGGVTACALAVAAPTAIAWEGTVGLPGCNVSYNTGTVTASPSGHVSYTGPGFSADTSSCVPETPPDLPR